MHHFILILRCFILVFLAGEHVTAKPNIVFLLADDQATISMGCYGNPDARTPNLDSLSERGVTFDNHYDTTAICMASRATILTGKYEYEHGCNFTKGKLRVNDFARSYPLLLRRAGYVTAFAGKFGVDLAEGLPVNSFDKWGGGKGQTSYVTLRNRWMKNYAKQYPHSTLSYGAFGRDFIKEATKTNKPFCLSISFKAPHMPDTPDSKFKSVYKNKTFKRPANFGRKYAKHLSSQSKQGRQWERWDSWGYSSRYDEVMRKYHQLVHGIDYATGMILDALQENGALDNTVIIYTSDNGFLCGSHGYGSKVLPYEESVRVPMIIFDPRHKSSGQGIRVSAITGNIDIAPTILELAGLKAEQGTEGKSLVSLMNDPEKEVHERLYLMNCWGPLAAQSFGVVTRDWKYIYWYYGKGMNPTEELFDMRKDKLELFNLVNRPEQIDALQLMRNHYDNGVKAIKNKAAPTHKVYGKLFDRQIPWKQKEPLIDSFKNN